MNTGKIYAARNRGAVEPPLAKYVARLFDRKSSLLGRAPAGPKKNEINAGKIYAARNRGVEPPATPQILAGITFLELNGGMEEIRQALAGK